MKRFFIFIAFISLFYSNTSFAQVQSLVNFSGWEFITWKYKKADTENILKKIGVKYSPKESYDSTRTIITFNFEELDTWLYFNTQNELSEVKQSRNFSVIYDKESKAFFEKVKKTMIQKYGKANREENDKTKEIITLQWDLNYTTIKLLFDYKYKIIDEFGCCSYKIDIHFLPKL